MKNRDPLNPPVQRRSWRAGLAALACLGLMSAVSAQTANQYVFSSSSGASLDPMTGATTLVGSNQDDAASGVTGIGFTFSYEGTPYTDFSVNSNGGMLLGGTVISAYTIDNINDAGSNPKIMAFQADGGTTPTGNVSSVLVGSTPNQVRIIQWNVGVDYNAPAPNCLFQVWLHEGSNVVDFRYGSGATIGGGSYWWTGISGAIGSNFLNVRPGPTASNVDVTRLGAWPGDDLVLTFTPPSASCVTPTPGNTLANATSICPGMSVALSVANPEEGPGITHQWESSPDGSTWTAIGGATGTTYNSAPLASTTWFHCVVTCSIGPASTASNPEQIVVSSPTPNYYVFAGTQYTEDFGTWQNLCSTNDVPDTYWTNSPAYGPGTWRSSATTTVESGWIDVGGWNYPYTISPGLPMARFHSREGGSVPGTLDFHIDMSAGSGGETIEFEYINYYGSGTLAVLISTDGGSTFTQTGSTLVNNTALETKSFTIGSTSANTVIRLKGTAGLNVGGNDIGVDNFRIVPVPACTAPTAPNATVTGPGSVDIGWTCTSCTGSFYVEYGTPGFALGTGTVAGPFGSSPATISGVANGNYQAYVRQDCGVDGLSLNSSPVNFSIVAGDFCANAIDLTTLSLGDWSIIGNTTGALNNYTSSSCIASLPGPDVVLYHDVEVGATISIGLWSSANRLIVAYGGSCPGTTSLVCTAGGYFPLGGNVQLVNDYETLIWTNNGCQTERLYFMGDGISSGGEIYVFNYVYTPATGPFCATINGVAVSTVNTGTNANVSWSASCSGNVIVEYGPEGFTPGTGATANGGTVVPMSGTSTSLSGLSMDVPYDVYVRNDCGSGNYGPNGTASTFTIFNGDDCTRVIALSGTTGALGINTTGTNDDISVCSAGNTGGDLVMSYIVEPGYGIYFASTPVGPYVGQVRIAYGSTCPGANELYCAAGATDYIWMNGTGVEQTVYFIQDGADEGATTVEWTYFTCTGNQVVVAINTDYNPSETTWEITDASNVVIASGGPTAAQEHMLVSETVCLGSAPENACYGFRLMDGYGDGINNGSWQLKSTSGRVLLGDDFANGTRSPSAVPANPSYTDHSFCLPPGNSHIAAKSCGIFNFGMNSKVYCNNAPGATSYQFEFSDPDAGFIRRIVVPSNSVRFSQMQTSPLVHGVTYFARVRNNGSGAMASAHFGGGCELGMGSTVPCTELISAPTYGHSCNETRAFNTNNSFIYAMPVTGATEYQFRVSNANEGYDETFSRSTYILQLKWNAGVAPPMVNGSTYNVQVNVKVGTVYSGFCGNTCTITIDNGGPRPEASMSQTAFGEAALWPNPVRESQVNLSIDGIQDADQHITVDIQDIYGKKVFAKAFGNSGERFTTILDLPSDIASGVYMVNITVNGQTTVQRLSIIK